MADASYDDISTLDVYGGDRWTSWMHLYAIFTQDGVFARPRYHRRHVEPLRADLGTRRAFGCRLRVPDRAAAADWQAPDRPAGAFRPGAAARAVECRPELDERRRQFADWRAGLGLDV